MKIERASTPFIPVTITLESQEEINQLSALTGRVKISLCPIVDKIYFGLSPFIDEERNKYSDALKGFTL